MLGLNRNAPELAGLVAGEEKDASSPFGVPFEHPGYLRESCVPAIRHWGLGADDHIIQEFKCLPALGFPPQYVRRTCEVYRFETPQTTPSPTGRSPAGARGRSPTPGVGCASR